MKGKLTTKTIVISVLIVLLLAVAVTASVIFLKDSGEASATEEQTTSTAGNAVSEEKNANITDDGENITTEEQKQTPEQNNTENAQNNVNNVNNNGNQVNGAVVGVLPEQQPAPTTIEQERVVSEETKLNWNNSGITGASTSVDSDELYIYYNNLEYKVEYIYEDIEETVIEIFEGNEKGKIIESYEDKAITGYELDKVENLPLEVTENQEKNVIKVYYAKKEYTATFKLNNGEEDIEITQKYGTDLEAPEEPTKEGHTFKGWDKELPSTMPDEDTVYEAQWEINKYTVTWKNYNGEVLETDENVEYGTTPEYNGETPTRAADTQYTYTFSGWDEEIKPVTGNVTYTAKYTETTRKYTVTFVDEDETTILKEATEYAYGTKAEEIVKPADPTKASTAEYTYTFSGWTPAIVDVTGNAVYTATYRATTNKYTVTFVDEDGITILKEATEYAYGTEAVNIGKPKNPTKAADDQYTYTFSGWTPAIADVTGNAVYTATYRATTRNYTVTFVDEDGTTVLKEATEYAYGTKAEEIVKPAEPTKEATAEYTYAFAGWTPTIADVTGNAVYKATYRATTRNYTVTFVDEDETTVLKEATEYAYGTKAEDIVKPAEPTKASTKQYTYTFSGWTPTIVDVTGNAVYTATYDKTVNKYTVTFVDEDGTVLKEATEYAYGTKAEEIVKPAEPTKEATAEYTYAFAGWTPIIVDVTGNAVYTATYDKTVNKYTVTFVDQDGTVLKEATEYAYGTKAEEIVKPVDPTKASTAEYTYAFAGWTPTIADVTGNAVYTATYRATTRNYTVTYYNENNMLNSYTIEAGENHIIKDDTELNLTPPKEYVFAGTWKDGNGVIYKIGDIKTITANLNLYAQFIKITNTEALAKEFWNNKVEKFGDLDPEKGFLGQLTPVSINGDYTNQIFYSKRADGKINIIPNGSIEWIEIKGVENSRVNSPTELNLERGKTYLIKFVKNKSGLTITVTVK